MFHSSDIIKDQVIWKGMLQYILTDEEIVDCEICDVEDLPLVTRITRVRQHFRFAVRGVLHPRFLVRFGVASMITCTLFRKHSTKENRCRGIFCFLSMNKVNV